MPQPDEDERSALSMIAKRMEIIRDRFSSSPITVSALNEAIAITRDAERVLNPRDPQDSRSIETTEVQDGS